MKNWLAVSIKAEHIHKPSITSFHHKYMPNRKKAPSIKQHAQLYNNIDRSIFYRLKVQIATMSLKIKMDKLQYINIVNHDTAMNKPQLHTRMSMELTTK